MKQNMTDFEWRFLLYPKCAKTHLRASVISKIFPELHPGPPLHFKGEEKEGKR
jgi:hypothetical protein